MFSFMASIVLSMAGHCWRSWGWSVLGSVLLRELQETRQKRAEELGKMGSSVPSPIPACRVSSGPSILAALPCPQAVLPGLLLLLHGEIKHFDFVS